MSTHADKNEPKKKDENKSTHVKPAVTTPHAGAASKPGVPSKPLITPVKPDDKSKPKKV